ncbi:MAG: BrnT family toxin [candidate division WS1 bacterium]|nr:BrnT family toxin [candidate division WS1 bacterium]
MIRRWRASRSALRHMFAKHGVTWNEVDEILSQEPKVLRSRTVRGEPRYLCRGRTAAGRKLVVIFAMEGTTARVITAYEDR